MKTDKMSFKEFFLESKRQLSEHIDNDPDVEGGGNVDGNYVLKKRARLMVCGDEGGRDYIFLDVGAKVCCRGNELTIHKKFKTITRRVPNLSKFERWLANNTVRM